MCDIPTGNEYTESFTIDNTNPLSLAFAVALTSTYAADVAAATAPSSAIAPVIAFSDASADVDCSTSDSWTTLTFTSAPDMAACIAMNEELNDWQSGEICSNQESQVNAGKIQQ